jgi:tetratricopeptide (TPR) repeat protein
MSPEQGRSAPLDARTDLYSLGVVLYEMVTGRVPFDADTPFAVVLRHINDPLPLPRQLDPDIPAPLEGVILKALAKAPADRFQTADALVRATQQAIAEAASAPTAINVAGAARLFAVAAEPAPASPDGAIPGPAAAALAAPAGARVSPRRPARTGLLAAAGLLGAAALVGAGFLLAAGRPPGPAPATPASTVTTIAGLPVLTDTTPAGATPGGTAPAAQTAAAMLASGQYAAALAAYEAVLDHDPQNAEALRGRGQALLGQQNYRDAVNALTEALALAPDDTVALLARAQAYAGEAAWDAAGTDAGRLLQLEPGNADALLVRAAVRAGGNDTAGALADYAAAIAARPADAAAYRARARYYVEQRQIAAALADLNAAIQRSPPDATLQMDLGDAYRMTGDNYEPEPAKALAAYNQALQVDPQRADAYVALAEVYACCDFEQALRNINRAIEIGPPTAHMYYLRSAIEKYLGDEKARLADLDRAVAVQPTATDPYTWRSDYYFNHRQYAQAAADMTQSITHGNEGAAAYASRSQLYLLGDDAVHAEADARHAIALNDKTAAGYLALAEVFFAGGNYQAALDQVDKAVALNEEYGRDMVLAGHARVAIKLGQLDRADADLAEAQRLYKQGRYNLLGLAELAQARGQIETAAGYLKDWNDGDYGIGYLLRAELEQQLQSPEAARKDLQNAQDRALFPEERTRAAALAAQLASGAYAPAPTATAVP